MAAFLEHLKMDNYGVYVWGAYGLSILAIAAMALQSLNRLRRIEHKLKRQAQQQSMFKGQP